MPTYDYVCKACEHRFELFQSMSAKPERRCPACGKHRLERLIGTGAAVLFKGSGFYQTDYRSDSYAKAAKAETGESKPADPAAKDSSKSDAASPVPSSGATAGGSPGRDTAAQKASTGAGSGPKSESGSPKKPARRGRSAG